MIDGLVGATAVDLILALMVVEGALLAVYRRRTGRGIAGGELVAMLAAGAFLLLALRGALTGATAVWIAGCLLAALIAHLVDVSRRWRR